MTPNRLTLLAELCDELAAEYRLPPAEQTAVHVLRRACARLAARESTDAAAERGAP